MSQERRDSPRTPLQGEAKVISGCESFTCRIVDISSSGIGLRSKTRHTPSPFVTVEFTPPRQSEPLSFGGILVSRRPSDSGFGWGVVLLSDQADPLEDVTRTQERQARAADELDTWQPGPNLEGEAPVSMTYEDSEEGAKDEKWWLGPSSRRSGTKRWNGWWRRG